MMRSKNVSKPGLKFVLLLAAASALVTTPAVLLGGNRLLAQTSPAPTFALPSALPEGANVRVDGSPSMVAVVEALKQRYETRFPGSRLNFTAADANAALQSLNQGNTDVIVIGRELTDQEKVQGLSVVPLEREKIAIIVGADNPFKGSITTEQFAQIFWGKITNWSQLGGPDAPIRFVDRPATSDTREALSRYPAFQQAPFQTGSTATQAAQDDTAAIARELGNNGISYAIRNQAEGQTGVQILPMHDTLPSDPRYPFSQPKVLVYKGNPAPQVLAFLGLATIPAGQEGVPVATTAPVVATPLASPEATAPLASPEATAPVVSPEATVPAAAPSPVATMGDSQGFPWWWLLLPLLGLAALWVLLRGRGAAVPPVAESYDSRIILTPRNCRHAYAFWEVSEDHKAALRREGGPKLMVRLHDVTDIPDMDRQKPHQIWQFAADERAQDLHMVVARDDRDYVVELGYTTDNDTWLPLARSQHVRVPRCTQADYGPAGGTSAFVKAPETAPVLAGSSPQALRTEPAEMAANGLRGATVAAIGTAAAAAAAVTTTRVSQMQDTRAVAQPVATSTSSALFEMPQDCRIILVPRNSKDAYAYWEVAEKYRQPLRAQGGKRLMLRIHDATNLDIDRDVPHSTQTYVCSDVEQDKHVTIPVSDRDYVADLGCLTDDGRWLRLIRSFHVRVPA